MPTKSLKSLASCNLAGRWCFRPTDSTQASHTNSLAAATIWGEAFWAFKCSANTFGSGWPKLVWSFFKSDLSWGSKSRNLGPWIEIGGGAHPSNWAGGWNPEALTIASSLGTGLGITPLASGTCLGRLAGGFAISSAWTLCSSTNVPKLVIINLDGTAARIRWARFKTNQSSNPKSWIDPVLLWMQTVWRMLLWFRSGRSKGNWNLSVPRHT